MADLSRERRKELTEALVWGSGMEHLAAMVASLLAAEREAGAAEVRARIEAVMEGWQDDKLHGVRYAHRCIWTALNGGE